MNEYLLDTNVVIELWRTSPFVIDKLIKDKKLKILKEVIQELAVKEKRRYKGHEILSERLCNLVLNMIEVGRKNINEFYSMLDIKHSKKGNSYVNTNKVSENDLALLYACYLNENFILVTEDKYLFNIANEILGQDRVMTLKMLVESVI